eukprot:2433730-Pyramimonas_sp.AAC.2
MGGNKVSIRVELRRKERARPGIDRSMARDVEPAHEKSRRVRTIIPGRKSAPTLRSSRPSKAQQRLHGRPAETPTAPITHDLS